MSLLFLHSSIYFKSSVRSRHSFSNLEKNMLITITCRKEDPVLSQQRTNA